MDQLGVCAGGRMDQLGVCDEVTSSGLICTRLLRDDSVNILRAAALVKCLRTRSRSRSYLHSAAASLHALRPCKGWSL